MNSNKERLGEDVGEVKKALKGMDQKQQEALKKVKTWKKQATKKH